MGGKRRTSQVSPKNNGQMLETIAYLIAMPGFVIYYLATMSVVFKIDPPTEEEWSLGASILIFVCYLVYVALSSCLPFGGKTVEVIQDGRNYTDVMTATATTVFSAFVVVVLEMRGFKVVELFLANLFQLSISALIVGILFSSLVHTKSFFVKKSQLNPAIAGKNGIVSYYLGREVRPRLFGLLDLKMYVNKCAVVAGVLSLAALLCRSISDWTERPFSVHVTFLAFFAMLLVYIFDGVLMEYMFETSKEMRQEGFGFGCGISYFIYPFSILAFLQHIYVGQVQLSHLRLTLNLLLFVVGFTVYRLSNRQIYNFRRNPTMSGTKSIATSLKDKKLLCSGFWGMVRHPNYLGDILVQFAMVGFTVNLPSLIFYIDIIFIIHRSYADDEKCRRRYGDAWVKYCEKVKYILVPGIY